MYLLYRNLTRLVAPLLPLWLEKRRCRGKEDANRMPERFGVASLPRPAGRLVWVHAASVGEANAALPLVTRLLAAQPALHVLMTTGTVTSAMLMAGKLPERAIHQFIPVDTPRAVHDFMQHWRPDIGVFIDSELWPNLIAEAARVEVVLGLVNARMSEKSYQGWQRWMPSLIGHVLAPFAFCFAQSHDDAARLQALGVPAMDGIGNIKYDVPPLSCDEAELAQLREATNGRIVWLAASTHSGEDALIAEAHRQMKQRFPDLLTVIVPRHPHRAEAILAECKGLNVARRSLEQAISPATDIYLADTMGELGLFYRLAQVAFIGGTLVPHGGQNPIEALKLDCPVVFGPSMSNFQNVAEGLLQVEAAVRVTDVPALVQAVTRLLSGPDTRRLMAERGAAHVVAHAGSLDAVVGKLTQYLARGGQGV